MDLGGPILEEDTITIQISTTDGDHKEIHIFLKIATTTKIIRKNSGLVFYSSLSQNEPS